MAETHASHTATSQVERTLQRIDKLFDRFWAQLEKQAQPTQLPSQGGTQRGPSPNTECYQTGAKPTLQTTKSRTGPRKPRTTGVHNPQRTPRGRKKIHRKRQTCNRTLHHPCGKQDLDLLRHRAWSPKSLVLDPARSQQEGECCPYRTSTLEKPKARSKSIPEIGIG
ncbi:Hypothetical predicted protein [Pelobates cultripes]|uniref:Uncharacterized protein n=1 Tax=Pelobates cultripes TaxID=61616 RepID=A0AAD1R9I1_PELCU|nr:Hypothetical predicted protein [Pelobates cultripes]